MPPIKSSGGSTPGGSTPKSAGKRKRDDNPPPAAVLDAESLDAYNCPICMDVQDATPLELACAHTFCGSCIKEHIKATGGVGTAICPVCRAVIASPPSTVKDMDARRALNARCGWCQATTPLLNLRQHIDTCPAALAAAAAPPPPAPPPPALGGGRARPSAVNRSTFTCPFCAEPNLPRAAFLDHLRSKHGRGGRSPAAVCPICASMPWGDANYVSQNLLAHCEMRHRFDYDTTTDFHMDEDAVLQAVLAKSMQDT